LYTLYNMPNDCWNHITIACKNKKYADQISDIVYNELKHEEGDKYVYNKTVNIIRRGTRGIEFKLLTAWRPYFEWLNVLLDRYPNCWVKNEWWEEEDWQEFGLDILPTMVKKMLKILNGKIYPSIVSTTCLS